MIDKIFELQGEIDKEYSTNISKGLEYEEKDILNLNKKISRLIEKQDKIRLKLMKYTQFNSDNDLGKCTGSQSIFMNTENKIICLLRKFRKHEGKFNLYYNKFHNEYEKFIKASGCSDAIKQSQLNFFSIEGPTKAIDSIVENTKCDKQDIADLFDTAMDEVTKVDENIKNNKNIQKKKNNKDALSEKSMAQAANFKTLIESFNARLELFKKLFIAAEAYGIHHYKANIAKKVKALSSFRREDQRYLIKQENLSLLASNPLFIKEFTKIIDDLEATNPLNLDTSVKSDKDDRNIQKTIIPNIPILTASFADMYILSINFNKMTYDPNKTMWEMLKLKNANIFNGDYYDTPKILCIQKQILERQYSFWLKK